jgi:hypothetical protein
MFMVGCGAREAGIRFGRRAYIQRGHDPKTRLVNHGCNNGLIAKELKMILRSIANAAAKLLILDGGLRRDRTADAGLFRAFYQ